MTEMQMDEFLYNLHFDIDRVRPPDAEVDWEDAPFPFKLYQDLPAVALPSPVPLKLRAMGSSMSQRSIAERARAPLDSETPVPVDSAAVDLESIGDFLWHSYGLTQMAHTILPSDLEGQPAYFMSQLRRYVPSGGGLYPNELYAYLKVGGLAPGIYHYDVAHHRLVLLREGNCDSYLERALGHPCDMSSCFGALFVSTMFWKNFYKYNNFAYRLQGVDAGGLIGQVIEVSRQYGYLARVIFEFLDGAVNHLLGLCEEDESVYAVIPLAEATPIIGSPLRLTGTGTRLIGANPAEPKPAETEPTEPKPTETAPFELAQPLCEELPPLCHRHYVKSQHIAVYPMLVHMNQASMLDSTEGFSQTVKELELTKHLDGDVTPLPRVSQVGYDFVRACQTRFSPGLDYVPGRMALDVLSSFFARTMEMYAHHRQSFSDDLSAGTSRFDPPSVIALCLHGVDGLADGAYLYDERDHALLLRNAGDHRTRLQKGMSMATVNLFQVPLCVHLVGSLEIYRRLFGNRGYRMLQMQVGILMQCLLLSASSLGLNGHPLLGYDERDCDAIYRFEHTGVSCLIQIPVGFYRKASRFEGVLHV